MSEKNQIILEKSVLTGLYKNVLIASNENKSIAPIVKKNNQNKDIRVIVLSQNNEMRDDERNFLAAILKACKVQMEDIELVCLTAGSTYAYNKPTDASYKKTLLFGITPEQIELPVRFPFFQIQSFEKTIYLSAPDLTAIEQDKKLKADLWHCLQKIFM